MRSPTRALIALALLLAAAFPSLAAAQEAAPIDVAPDEFMRGTVTAVRERRIEGAEDPVSEITIRVDSGTDAGRDVQVMQGGAFADPETGVARGDRVVVVRSASGSETSYYLADRYRLPGIAVLVALLVAAAVIVGGKRGVSATLGLAASIGILALVVLPQIAGGGNPLLITFLGGIAIATVTTFIAHGASRESMIVLASILAALAIGTLAAWLSTLGLRLGGFGSEGALSLAYGPLAGMDLRGLLVAGVVLGVLGVLDDVAATQVAAVKEVSAADPRLTARQLYRRGMRVGAEHVAALINTLFLAYAGASLPLLLVGMVNLQLPLWAFLNTESVAEEIVRTVVGSGSLVLAVPIATLLASRFFGAKRGLRGEKPVV